MADENTNAKTVQKASKAPAGEKKMVEVEALVTPVKTYNAVMAKGGRCIIDEATAELKVKSGEVTIVRVVG